MMLNMSQEQLGNGLGLTFQQVQKYEKGLNRIGAGRLYHIAKLLAIEPAFFFQGLPEVADTEADPRVAHRQQEVSAFMASPDGYAIVMALSEITDSNVRRRILDLVRAVGGVDMPAEGH
ncbi:MAG: helix-turn-helix domain-containing protein [Pseudomonadota bacterium]